ncbi:MAG: hypothetical protein D4S01_07395 [Dehalococcoidia bacterium]|nr:MAG: hypothetical protein D4S01_07395 [Dehalococcoidia bacterium]
MNKFVELKDTETCHWKGMCDNYARARSIDDTSFIKMFEGFFKEKGILMVSQAFLDAIATGG